MAPVCASLAVANLNFLFYTLISLYALFTPLSNSLSQYTWLFLEKSYSHRLAAHSTRITIFLIVKFNGSLLSKHLLILRNLETLRGWQTMTVARPWNSTIANLAHVSWEWRLLRWGCELRVHIVRKMSDTQFDLYFQSIGSGILLQSTVGGTIGATRRPSRRRVFPCGQSRSSSQNNVKNIGFLPRRPQRRSRQVKSRKEWKLETARHLVSVW